ncbi:hypothetical protein OUZ56_019410 [Daphnia magna]|uniref:Uncharacterized protein n=1 Tax=Daphnia magna TaxID=35525 RepID=A0ABQ9ZBH7_9CRUS|nr:hypothetical protein OUZ56_019410 [Daphnia magna]
MTILLEALDKCYAWPRWSQSQHSIMAKGHNRIKCHINFDEHSIAGIGNWVRLCAFVRAAVSLE